jgi:hypothetical protein
MNVDLPKDAVARVNELVGCIRRNYGNAAGRNVTLFIADRHPGRAFDDKRNLDVRMFMQRRTLPGFGGDDVSGERRTLRFADELMRHSNERQLLEIQKTHAFAVNIFVSGFQPKRNLGSTQKFERN